MKNVRSLEEDLRTSFSICASLPDSLKHALGNITGQLKSKLETGRGQYSIMPEDNLHMTFNVLGPLTIVTYDPAEDMKAFKGRKSGLIRMLNGVARRHKQIPSIPFNPQLHLLTNDDAKLPFIICVEPTGGAQVSLGSLWHDLKTKLGPHYPKTRRDFSPHICLARASRDCEETLTKAFNALYFDLPPLDLNNFELTALRPDKNCGSLINRNGGCGKLVPEKAFELAPPVYAIRDAA